MNPCIVALGALVAFWFIIIAVLISAFGMETVLYFGIAMSVIILAAAFVHAFCDMLTAGQPETKREVTK